MSCGQIVQPFLRQEIHVRGWSGSTKEVAADGRLLDLALNDA